MTFFDSLSLILLRQRHRSFVNTRRHNQKIIWLLNGDEKNAIKTLFKKLILLSTVVLHLAREHKTFDDDACERQIDCVLLQEKPGKTKKSVGYWPRSLLIAKNAYETTRRDLFAIIWPASLLWLYLNKWRFTIRTDHDSPCLILNQTEYQDDSPDGNYGC